jgi:pyruvate formate lyase activating enzyme
MMKQQSETIGYISKLESFGLVDGPGVRFVVFLQGCPMRCRYCHNPETWSLTGGEAYTPRQLFDRVYRYRNYWKNNGGITVSGGEPLLQIDFLIEFFRLAHKKGIHTALDTSGGSFSQDPEYLKKFDELMKYTNLVILDLKEIRPEEHLKLTGRPNAPILAMARYLSEKKIPLWIRHVLVPGLTDDEQSLRDLDAFIQTLQTVERVEILPYHNFAIAKWKSLGIPYTLEDAETPSPEAVQHAEELLHIQHTV